jgi:hypothetical protein
MSEKTVVIAEFATAGEAHLALNRLEAESIPGFVTGAGMLPTDFSIFGRLQFSAIQLHVPESHARRANEILMTVGIEQPPPKGWEAEAEDAVDGWICSVCDTQAEEEATVCPACETPRKKRSKKKRP